MLNLDLTIIKCRTPLGQFQSRQFFVFFFVFWRRCLNSNVSFARHHTSRLWLGQFLVIYFYFMYAGIWYGGYFAQQPKGNRIRFAFSLFRIRTLTEVIFPFVHRNVSTIRTRSFCSLRVQTGEKSEMKKLN